MEIRFEKDLNQLKIRLYSTHLNMVGAGLSHRVNKIDRVVDREVAVWGNILRKGLINAIVSSPHVAKGKFRNPDLVKFSKICSS